MLTIVLKVGFSYHPSPGIVHRGRQLRKVQWLKSLPGPPTSCVPQWVPVPLHLPSGSLLLCAWETAEAGPVPCTLLGLASCT